MSDGHNLTQQIIKLVKETIVHPVGDGDKTAEQKQLEKNIEARGELLADKILTMIMQEQALRDEMHRMDMRVYRTHALLLVERFDSLSEAFRLFAKAFSDTPSERKEDA